MASLSTIEWTESTWNPVTGCTKVSPGCKFCYAERMANRLQAMGSPNYQNGFNLALHPHILEAPLKWRKPQMIFVNSMSDLFHDDVPLKYIQKIFDVMKLASQHKFQILTKRADRLEKLNKSLIWPDNVWMGVSVEDKDYLFRINYLKKISAKIKFLSLEPLLGPLHDLDLNEIDWVIVGGESGPGARPIKSEWVIEIREQCVKANVPFFFKQWGGFNKKKSGRVLEGRTWDQMPEKPMPATG